MNNTDNITSEVVTNCFIFSDIKMCWPTNLSKQLTCACKQLSEILIKKKGDFNHLPANVVSE